MKRRLSLLLCLLLLLTLLPGIPATAEENTAQEISGAHLVTQSSGFPSVNSLFDSKRYDGYYAQDGATLTLSHEGGIGSLYLTFGRTYGTYTITNNDNGETITAGEYGYAHEFVDLQERFGAVPQSVTLCFNSGNCALHELKVFGPGQVGDTIQKWQEPLDGETDLILFATHSDDDQLFFAGLLPYYAVERGYQVQVVYLTSHYNTAPFRVHEVLDGLWAVGIRSYPVFGAYPDFGDTSTLDGALQRFAKFGHSREDMTGFVVEQLRRFKPMVVVAHDFQGEYGHAQHRVFARLVADAVEVSFDPEAYPETAETYGVWDVPKTYVHLYRENEIVMDWDVPMENFGGMTPYQVTKELGFPCHSSQQQWAWFFKGHDTCASIPNYNPSHYGLYRSTVGADEAKNDMFENVNSHGELKAIAEEEARLKAEEEARLKAEEEARKASEEARLQAEEEARRASEKAAQQAQTEPATQATAPNSQQSEVQPVLPPLWLLAVLGSLVLLLIILLILLCRSNRRQKRKKKHR